MNRKHGQAQRMNSNQSMMRGNRSGQSNNSQYGKNFSHSQDIDNDFDLSGSRSRRSGSSDDTYETGRGYRDTDYDLDGSTYG